PGCGEQLTVPTDALFNDEGAEPDHTWFAFSCPACNRRIKARPEDAHLTAVCPHCQRALRVPPGGRAAVAARPAQEKAGPLAGMWRRPCSCCGRPVPVGARVCRACGHAPA